MTIKELLPILDYDVDEVTFTIRDYNLQYCDKKDATERKRGNPLGWHMNCHGWLSLILDVFN